MRLAALAVLAVLSMLAAAPDAMAQGGRPGLAQAGDLEPQESRSLFGRWKDLIGRVRDKTAPGPGDVQTDTVGPGFRSATPRFQIQEPALLAQQPEDDGALVPLPYGGPLGDPSADPRSATASASSELRRITEILPYPDYEPDPDVRREDPCLNLCPRPDDPNCKIYPEGREPLCPVELRLSGAPWQPREIAPSVFTWEASNLYHYPLYFEDPPLERYGHTYGCLIQPLASIGRFGTQLVGLPYQMTIDPACRKIYTLGWYRPGECAPKLHYQIPWHHQAALNQALVVTGLFYLIP